MLLWIVAAPLLAAQRVGQPARITGWDTAGIVFWALGLFGEAFGDWQLHRFIHAQLAQANKGWVLQTGLWRYTRPLSYFEMLSGGECLSWL